jgi:integrase
VSDGCTLRTLCNDFLRSKEEKLNADDLSPRTFRDYYKTCEGLLAHFGKERRVDDLRPDDFRKFRSDLAKRLGVTSLKNEINRCCIVFNYAHENNLIDKPVSYGQNFDRPSAKALRRNRNAAGPKLFDRDEILRLLDAVDGKPVAVTGRGKPVTLSPDPVPKAMILLGINCGFGNTDVASLPQSAVDLKTRWIEFPRPKTEIRRRIPLWPETVDALKKALAIRPAPANPADDHLCFLTRQGRPWVRVKLKEKSDSAGDAEQDANSEQKPGPEVYVPIDALSGEFGKVLDKLHINGRRGLGFYTLRHCFETQAGESKDQVAVDSVMGHVDSSMAANYRHRISDDRLKAVVETVRTWLYPPPSPAKKTGATPK